MGASPTIHVTSIAEQSVQMEHPTPEAIWSRAVEVFDGEELAGEWMDNPLAILEGQTPREVANSRDEAKLRNVLTVLARIDYGMFS